MLTKTEKERLAALLRKKATTKRRAAKKVPTKRRGGKLPTPAEVARAYGVNPVKRYDPAKNELKIKVMCEINGRSHLIAAFLDTASGIKEAKEFATKYAKQCKDIVKVVKV